VNELLTIDEMYRADRLAMESGIGGTVLMENAGIRIGEQIVVRWPKAGRVLVICGPGNNGGDGFVIARFLQARGYDVGLALLGDVAKLKGDAAAMAAQWDGEVLGDGEVLAADPMSMAGSLAGADLIVDALFGAGLARPVAGKAAGVVDKINAAGVPVVAVDLPSGVDGETGRVLGACVKADLTVTFFRKKAGHLLCPGRDFCGETVVADIGIPGSVLDEIAPKMSENGPALWRGVFPEVASGAHKYSRGHAIVVSGGLATTGAARLGARAALRIGAGVVTIACPENAVATVAAHETAVMVRGLSQPDGLDAVLSDPRVTAVLAGPGNGVGMPARVHVLTALESDAGIVLDADALTSFAHQPDNLFDAIARRRANSVVLTPHEGEFSRLFQDVMKKDGGLTDEASRIERAVWGARCAGAILVLKGPDTVIAAPDGRVAVNGNAPPWLATAGSGDVLAGIAAGLLAQGMPAFEAACAAVWLHGEAGQRFGRGLVAEDLAGQLPAILQAL